MNILFWFMALFAAAGVAAAQQPSVSTTVSGLGCLTSLGADTFSVTTWTLNVDRPTSVPAFGELEIHKNSDACSANLLAALNSQQKYSSVILSEFNAASTLVMKVQISNVQVSVYNPTGGSETVRFSYSKVQLTTNFPNTKSSCWDIAGSKSC